MTRFTALIKNDPRQILLLPNDTSINSNKNFAILFQIQQINFDTSNVGEISIQLVDLDSINRKEWTRLTSGYGCLGFLSFEKDIYLLIISEQSLSANIKQNEQIHRINSVQFISLLHSNYDVDFDKLWAIESDHYEIEDDTPEPNYPYDPIKQFLSQNYFYYSNNYDLTRFTQSRIEQNQIYQFDETFLWNTELIYPIRSFFHTLNPNKKKMFLTNGFMAPMIQGFCDFKKIEYGQDVLNIGIISRMGWKRAGTRFNTRGIDDSGNVANFTETEIIFFDKNFLFSFLQIRGSVPAFWEQNGLQLMGHKIQIIRGFEATQPACFQHLNRILQRYRNVQIVNLLSQKEGAEQQLGHLYSNLVAGFNSTAKSQGKLYLVDFDFHAVCKGNNFQNALLLVDQMQDRLEEFGFCGVDIATNKMMHYQEGVFRTNCLDCLDRTNVIQGLLTQYHLKRILQEFGLSHLHGQLIPIISKLTGENGDAISKIYTGTGALKSSFTKSGKSSFAGLLNDASKSVNRMYIGAVTDKIKQELTDILLGKLPGQIKLVLDGPSPFDSIPKSPNQKALEINSSSNVPPTKLTIHCGTYNVNGRHPSGQSLVDWILPPKLDEDIPDLYVMAFQEIVELTPSQILNADLGRKFIWQNILIKDLNTTFPNGNYVFLTSEQLVGITILIFARDKVLPFVNQLEKSIKKTGFSGIAGNKGAAAIRFTIGSVSFCFVACHFASGQSKVEERNFDYQTIHNELTFGFNRTINHHNVIVYLGDFNYRINLSNEQVRQMAHNQDHLDQLLAYDQLKRSMQRGYAFSGFSENPIDFFPTYRYDIGTDIYDTSEKRRIPAWTDRILYKGTGVTCNYYTRAELRESDHKPVMAGFKVDLAKCLDEVKERVTRTATHDKPITSFSQRHAPVKSQPPPRPPKPQVANLIDFDSETPTLDCKGLPPPSNDNQQWWSLSSKNRNTNELVNIQEDHDPFDYQFPPHSWNPKLSTNPFRQPGFHFPDFSIQQKGHVQRISSAFTPRNQQLLD